MPTQLYAEIKKSSEYYDQNATAKADPNFGLPFPVEIRNDALSYVVAGGPGGQYQLQDVQLFALANGKYQPLT